MMVVADTRYPLQIGHVINGLSLARSNSIWGVSERCHSNDATNVLPEVGMLIGFICMINAKIETVRDVSANRRPWGSRTKIKRLLTQIKYMRQQPPDQILSRQQRGTFSKYFVDIRRPQTLDCSQDLGILCQWNHSMRTHIQLMVQIHWT